MCCRLKTGERSRRFRPAYDHTYRLRPAAGSGFDLSVDPNGADQPVGSGLSAELGRSPELLAQWRWPTVFFAPWRHDQRRVPQEAKPPAS